MVEEATKSRWHKATVKYLLRIRMEGGDEEMRQQQSSVIGEEMLTQWNRWERKVMLAVIRMRTMRTLVREIKVVVRLLNVDEVQQHAKIRDAIVVKKIVTH